MSETQDLTLDEIRALLAPILPRHAAFDGWRPQAVAMAAQQQGIDPDIAQLAFADGPFGMIDAWFASIDARMVAALPPFAQEIVLYIPTVHGVEYVREGWFGLRARAVYDLPFLISVNLVLSVAGLIAVRWVSRRVVPE